MMGFWVKFFFGSKNIWFFSNFNAINLGKMWELLVVERAKIVTLNEEGYLERQISKN